MADRVRVGMIGTSWYADSMHLPSLTSHPQADVVAICGRNAARAQEMAAAYPQVMIARRTLGQVAHLEALVLAQHLARLGRRGPLAGRLLPLAESDPGEKTRLLLADDLHFSPPLNGPPARSRARWINCGRLLAVIL